jgi:hypothetical protein
MISHLAAAHALVTNSRQTRLHPCVIVIMNYSRDDVAGDYVHRLPEMLARSIGLRAIPRSIFDSPPTDPPGSPHRRDDRRHFRRSSPAATHSTEIRNPHPTTMVVARGDARIFHRAIRRKRRLRQRTNGPTAYGLKGSSTSISWPNLRRHEHRADQPQFRRRSSFTHPRRPRAISHQHCSHNTTFGVHPAFQRHQSPPAGIRTSSTTRP